MSYKEELAAKLIETGIKKKWLAARMGIPKVTFWRKVIRDTLTKEQKEKINSHLQIYGSRKVYIRNS